MRLRDEQGMMAIGVALMLIVVLSLFGGALWQYSMVETNRVERTEQDMQALFLARAGAEVVMAAWLAEPVASKPAGPMERIYYNSDEDCFQTIEPPNYLGYVDVMVTKIDDPGGERDQLTEIVATGVVNGASRTVKVTTYPHLLGHDQSLRWYSENTGVIQFYDYDPVEELVIVRSERPIHFQRYESFADKFMAAPWILFETPLDLGHSQEDDYLDSLNYRNHNLTIAADTIIFHDIWLKDLPSRWSMFSLRSTVTLRLPGEEFGIPGSEIPGADPTARYGKVYFDGEAGIRKFRWTRTWFLVYWYKIVANGTEALLSASKRPLARNAYYFRDGTDLFNIGPQDLIPLESDGERANQLRNIQPFVWE